MIPSLPPRRSACLVVLLALAACGPQRPERPPFDADRAWVHLTSQISLGPRFAGHRGHRLAAPWFRDQLGFRADTVLVETFAGTSATGRPVQHANYVARFRPELADRVLLVTHWDTPRHAERDPDPAQRTRYVPGANEGASGTAVLIEVAQLLNETAPPVGVDLLFADASAEGSDAAGVRTFLSNRPDARWRWAAWVDRVGDNDLRLQADAGSAPALAERFWGVAKEIGRDSVWVAGRTTAPASSAAAAIAARGIPTVSVVDREHGKGNVFWRTTRDVPANASRESLFEVGDVLAELIYREEAPKTGS